MPRCRRLLVVGVHLCLYGLPCLLGECIRGLHILHIRALDGPLESGLFQLLVGPVHSRDIVFLSLVVVAVRRCRARTRTRTRGIPLPNPRNTPPCTKGVERGCNRLPKSKNPGRFMAVVARSARAPFVRQVLLLGVLLVLLRIQIVAKVDTRRFFTDAIVHSPFDETRSPTTGRRTLRALRVRI